MQLTGLAAVFPFPLLQNKSGRIYEFVFNTTPQSITFLPGEVIPARFGSRRLVSIVDDIRVDTYKYNSDNNLIRHKMEHVKHSRMIVEVRYEYDSQKRITLVDRQTYTKGESHRGCTKIEFDFSGDKERRTETRYFLA